MLSSTQGTILFWILARASNDKWWCHRFSVITSWRWQQFLVQWICQLSSRPLDIFSNFKIRYCKESGIVRLGVVPFMLLDVNGLFTLHTNGTRTGTANWTRTVGDNGPGSFLCLRPLWTFQCNILVPFGPSPVPCTCPGPVSVLYE